MPLREIEKNLTVRKVEKGKKEEKKYGTRFYEARVLLDFSNIIRNSSPLNSNII